MDWREMRDRWQRIYLGGFFIIKMKDDKGLAVTVETGRNE